MNSKLRALFLWFLLIFQLGLFAQTPMAKWTIFDTTVRMLNNGLIGSDESGTYMFCSTGDKEALNGIWKTEPGSNEVEQMKLYPFSEIGKYKFWPKCLLSGGHLWATIVKRDSKTKKAQLIVRAINKNTLQYSDDPKVVAEFDMGSKPLTFVSDVLQPEGCPYIIVVTGDINGSYFQLYNSNFELVRDRTDFGFRYADFYMASPFTKGGINSDEVWTFERPLYNSFYQKMMTGISADSAGDVYANEFFFSLKKTTSETRKGSYLFVYPKNSAKPVEIALDEDDGKCSYTTMAVRNGEVICAGFYSSMDRILPEGIKYVRVNGHTGQVIVTRKQALSDAMLKGLSLQEKELDVKAWAEFKHHYFLHPLLQGSGADVYLLFQHDMIFEGRPISVPGMNNNEVKSDQPTDHQIVAVHLSDRGDILWQQKIQRDLRGSALGNDPSSCFPMVKNGTFYAFYIDDAENIRANHDNINAEQHPGSATFTSDSYHALVATTISAQGSMGRFTLTSLPWDYALHPGKGFYDGKGNVIIPAYPFGGGYASTQIKKIATISFSNTPVNTAR